MPRRLPIIAYHIVFGAYSFWLPNDPRGSWSKYVWAARLQRFGPAEPIRASHEPTPEEEQKRHAMKEGLLYPPVRFSGLQARAVGRGFGEIVYRLGWAVYAAAIMPDHVHVVVARQDLHAEKIAGLLKRAASRRLRTEAMHPLACFEHDDGSLPSPWEKGGWKVFLHTRDEIAAAHEYVTRNPTEAGLPPQQWNWVVRYDG